MKQLLFATLAVLGMLLAVPPARADSITLPSYAQGSDLRGALESRGRAISDLLAFVAGIVGIIGIIVGGHQDGRRRSGRRQAPGAVGFARHPQADESSAAVPVPPSRFAV